MIAASRPVRVPVSLGEEDYLPLDRLSVALTKETTDNSGSFTLCFWIYILKKSRAGVIIRQGRPSAATALPFLTISSSNLLTVYPLPPPPVNAGLEFADGSRNDKNLMVMSSEPVQHEKWIHVGCEVGPDKAKLHVDGRVVGQCNLPSGALTGESDTATDVGGPILLSGGDGSRTGGGVQAYAHFVRLLPMGSVTDHFVKNPPLVLTLDGAVGPSEDNEFEEEKDGVWSVVGGKASCRRNFSLDVILSDALGRSVHRDMEIAASLVYSDDSSPVQKLRDDAEAPLLTTFDGVEFPSTDRPVRLQHGRASFKLKISQLSSKCENRLFRVRFEPLNAPPFPFLQALSRPICCVSRNRQRGGKRMPNSQSEKSGAAESAGYGESSPLALMAPSGSVTSGGDSGTGGPPRPNGTSSGAQNPSPGSQMTGLLMGQGMMHGGTTQSSPLSMVTPWMPRAATPGTPFAPATAGAVSAATTPSSVALTPGPGGIHPAIPISTRNPAAKRPRADEENSALQDIQPGVKSTEPLTPMETNKSFTAQTDATPPPPDGEAAGMLPGSVADSKKPKLEPSNENVFKGGVGSASSPAQPPQSDASGKQQDKPSAPLGSSAAAAGVSAPGQGHGFPFPFPFPPGASGTATGTGHPQMPPYPLPFPGSFPQAPNFPLALGKDRQVAAATAAATALAAAFGGYSPAPPALLQMAQGLHSSLPPHLQAYFPRPASQGELMSIMPGALPPQFLPPGNAAADGMSGKPWFPPGWPGAGTQSTDGKGKEDDEVSDKEGAKEAPKQQETGEQSVQRPLQASSTQSSSSQSMPSSVTPLPLNVPSVMHPLRDGTSLPGHVQAVPVDAAATAAARKMIEIAVGGMVGPNHGTGSHGDSSIMLQSMGGASVVPDRVVFKYCLESMTCRAEFLKEAVSQFSEVQLAGFASRVATCTGCEHNGRQILMSKRLLGEGASAWRQLQSKAVQGPHGQTGVRWQEVITHVERSFYKTVGTKARRLDKKAKEFMRRIAGLGGNLDICTRVEFEQLWMWLFPLALTLSQPLLRRAWESTSPLWIAGFVFREEADTVLHQAHTDPFQPDSASSFLVRFASSRLWPHPDAGSLVISYVDAGTKQICHKLLCLDETTLGLDSVDAQQLNLSDLLLAQSELKRLTVPPWHQEQNHPTVQAAPAAAKPGQFFPPPAQRNPPSPLVSPPPSDLVTGAPMPEDSRSSMGTFGHSGANGMVIDGPSTAAGDGEVASAVANGGQAAPADARSVQGSLAETGESSQPEDTSAGKGTAPAGEAPAANASQLPNGTGGEIATPMDGVVGSNSRGA